MIEGPLALELGQPGDATVGLVQSLFHKPQMHVVKRALI